LFDLNGKRTHWDGYATLTSLFRTVDKWDLRKHVFCKNDGFEWSVMPCYISNQLANYLGTYMRLHVIGAATNTEPLRVLALSKVTFNMFNTKPSDLGCRCNLRATVHAGNGVCWCGTHPPHTARQPPKDDDEKSVRIDVRCCGRSLRRAPDGSYTCGVHKRTTLLYHPNEQSCAMCAEDLVVTVRCVHTHATPPVESAGYKSQRTEWTNTEIVLKPDKHERNLVCTVLNSAVRTHNLLAKHYRQACTNDANTKPTPAEHTAVHVMNTHLFMNIEKIADCMNISYS
jgi:hypothetical protein